LRVVRRKCHYLSTSNNDRNLDRTTKPFGAYERSTYDLLTARI
jgi:hypothetical protein